MNYLATRLKSFTYAFAGIAFLIRNEVNAKIHLLATILVVVFAILLSATGQDWMWLTFAIAIVWVAEALNTALEHLCNAITVEEDENIKRAKDIAAGAVLMAAISAAIIGILVFYPLICTAI